MEGAQVLDLFAGTGALGLEALSRGAAQASFVDDGRVAQKLLAGNIATLGVRERTRVMRCSALRLPQAEEAADLIFLDPPYGKGLGEEALAAALAGGWISDGALIVWEESAAITPPEGMRMIEERRYGDTMIRFLERG